MPLPILHAHRELSPDDLVRLWHQTENRWCQHIAEESPLDIGTAYTNPSLSAVHDANNIRDVALPAGMAPAAAVQLVADHYAAHQVRCAYWTVNPAAPPDQTRPLIDYLLAHGYESRSFQIMLLGRAPAAGIAQAPGLTIIPARASFRHTRALREESARQWATPQLADATMLHLDDPHWDALLALQDGQPVGYIGVLAVGEVGRIDEVYVAEAHRGQGIGQTMLSRALEICARSLFKQVMLAVRPDCASAIRLYEKFGFRPLAEVTSYYAAGG